MANPTYTVTTEAELDADLVSADTVAGQGTITIDISGQLTETSDPTAINLAAGNTLIIDGADHAVLNGADIYRGLFVYAGQVTVENLTIENAQAQGGAGGAGSGGGGGGGAGLGGGLLVASAGNVTLSGVTFDDDAAKGGAGGGASGYGYGGGGGLGGAGGAGNIDGNSLGGGGGGGIGSAAAGGAPLDPNGDAGIVAGSAGGAAGTPSDNDGLGSPSGGGGGLGASSGGGGGIAASGIHGGFGGGGGGGGGGTGAGSFGGGGGGGSPGGQGGFGGGGGGSFDYLAGGESGFGGGDGGGGAILGGGGGGGLAAGGDVFVQQGGALTVIGGSLGVGTVTGGDGTRGGTDGEAYGNGIFIQGNQSVTLAAPSGTTLSVAGAIADETGSGGGTANPGAGSLVIGSAADPGTVELTPSKGTNTYTGGTTIMAGTLDLAAAGAAGTGAITFAAGSDATLAVAGAALTAGSPDRYSLTNAIDGFGVGDTIKVENLASNGAVATLSDGILSVANGDTTDTFATPDATAPVLLIVGGQGTDITAFATLSAAIAAADSMAANTGPITIDLQANETETTDPEAVNLASDNTLMIDGNGDTLSGAEAYRGLFVYAGQVTVENLTIKDTVAVGGAGGAGSAGGGGGAGLGGGLFVASAGQVTLSGVTFQDDSATGGAGGADTGAAAGGGGGLGGAGGGAGHAADGGGGGGIGNAAAGGSSFSPNGQAGIVAGSTGAAAGFGGLEGDGGPSGGGGGFGTDGGGGGIAPSGQAGGFGGGSGGFAAGGGGFGGGGGASGGSVDGTDGGFGGGGGGADLGGGEGGFGGGNAGPSNHGNGGGGGGGLGAGGDVFVQEGGLLTVLGGSLGSGDVTAGAGADGGQNGQAYGSTLFIQGDQSVTLAAPTGATLSITGTIADESGSGGGTANPGAGTLVIGSAADAGTVVLDPAGGANTYIGGTTLESGTLELATLGAAGTGAITFAGSPATLRLDAAAFAPAAASNTYAPKNAVAGLATGDTIDLGNLAPAAGSTFTLSGSTLDVTNGTITDALKASGVTAPVLLAAADGAGGTAVTGYATLGAAITAADGLAAGSGGIAIELLGNETETADLTAINLASGNALLIDGDGATLNGAGQFGGLFVYSGTVTVENLTLKGAAAVGGAGGSGGAFTDSDLVGGAGGGGAGLGGGLFVASAGVVTLSGVTFQNDSATGGAGGSDTGTGDGGGGGLGGPGGAGRDATTGGGGGGGIGSSAAGGGGTTPDGDAGIVPGGGDGAAGSGGNVAAGTGGPSGGGGGAGASAGGGGIDPVFTRGGFGGGGGHSGAGGFGGGGSFERSGGFGGGGGGFSLNESFGGGAANGALGGGGGLGAGGDVFVQAGASLTVVGGSLGAGSITAGLGSDGAQNGQAYGSAVFIQGNQSVTLAAPTGTTLTVAGTIADETGSGGGTANPGTGTLLIGSAADPGTVTLDPTGAPNTYTGGTMLTAGTLVLGTAGAGGSGAITFGANSGATLGIDGSIMPGETIAGFAQGDTINLASIAYASGGSTTLTAGNLLEVTESGHSYDLQLDPAQSFAGEQFILSDPAGTDITLAPVCYCAGTRILTVAGEVPVEDLAVGDLVITSSGAHRPIRWLGHRMIDCRHHPRPHEALPVRIAAHALGPDKPARDLLVSPGHALCIDLLGEVLIPAGALLNGTTIQQIDVDQVTYWHVELDSHDILLAENLPAESYLEMGNRAFFQESGIVALDALPDADAPTHADFCRPMHLDGPLMDVVRSQLRLVAAGMGWSLDASDPFAGLHLAIDGVRTEPVRRGLTACFSVPAGARDVWLVSATSRPRDIGHNSDDRDLGLCLSRLTINDGFGAPHDIPIDDALLRVGFHAVESGLQRWTAGRAHIPAPLWAHAPDGFFLRVELHGPALARWIAPAAGHPVERSRVATPFPARIVGVPH